MSAEIIDQANELAERRLANGHPEHAHQPQCSFSYSLPRLQISHPGIKKKICPRGNAVYRLRRIHRKEIETIQGLI